MSTLRNFIIFLILVVLLKDVIVKIPSWIIGGIDTVGHMPAKTVAIIILVVAGIFVFFKERKK